VTLWHIQVARQAIEQVYDRMPANVDDLAWPMSCKTSRSHCLTWSLPKRGILSLPGMDEPSPSIPTLRAKFGRRLRQLRRQRDITQDELAEAIGTSANFLTNIERGVNASSFETIEKPARVLKVEMVAPF
jgi:DNA-binding XRE family transcriptional regulator